MQSIACTLVLMRDSSQKANLSIVREDDGNQTWSRWGSDVGGLRLYDNHGDWRYFPVSRFLMLRFAKRASDGGARVIGLDEVPFDFFKAVTCSRSASGPGDESHTDERFRYTLWFGCF